MQTTSPRPVTERRTIVEHAFRACFGAFVIWLALSVHLKLEGDTRVVVWGWGDLARCLRAWNFAPCTTLSYFAPLQTVSVTPFKLMRMDEDTILRAFALVSVAGSILLLYRGFRTLQTRSMLGARLFVLAALGSPMLFYSGSSFSELWLCCLLILIVDSCISGTPIRIAILTFLAGTAKETAPPFVLAMALCSLLWGRAGPNRFDQKTWVAPFAGTASAVLVNVSLNIFRYRSLWNAFYTDEGRRVQDGWDHVSFFLGMWFSPSGGFFLFWPLLALCAAIACTSVVFHYIRARRIDAHTLPFLVMCGGQFALTLGLSKWHAPFGWICWGSRLHLPWILPTAFLLGMIYAREIETFATRYLGSRQLRIIIGLLLGLASLPHLFVTFDPFIGNDVFRLTDVCPRVPAPNETESYYKCMHEYLWPVSNTLVRSFGLIMWDARMILGTLLYLGVFVFGSAALPIRTGVDADLANARPVDATLRE